MNIDELENAIGLVREMQDQAQGRMIGLELYVVLLAKQHCAQAPDAFRAADDLREAALEMAKGLHFAVPAGSIEAGIDAVDLTLRRIMLDP